MLGAIIGDAVGSAYEFHNTKDYNFWFFLPESNYTDFSELTDEMLAEIEWKLNHRPRKSLGYRTPLEYCIQLFNFDF